MKIKRKFLRGADILLALCLLILCAVLFSVTHSGEKKIAVVTINGEKLYEIDLDSVAEDYTLTLDNGVVLQVGPGEIAFLSSDCKGLACVRSGTLSAPGQTAACLPNKTVIYITGNTDKNAPDAIAY